MPDFSQLMLKLALAARAEPEPEPEVEPPLDLSPILAKLEEISIAFSKSSSAPVPRPT